MRTGTTEYEGTMAPRGDLALKVIRGNKLRAPGAPYVMRGQPPGNLPASRMNDVLRDLFRTGLPSMQQSPPVRAWKVRNLRHLARGLKQVLVARQFGIATIVGQVHAVKIFGLYGPHPGQYLDLGLISLRVVTDVGVGFIVDAFQNLVELELMNFHGIGTGTGAEAVGDTALGTELTTEYNPNSTRATGVQTEPATNQYRSTGTNTLDSGTPAITEHGLFSANAAGVLFDRSVFAAINLVGANGDGLQTQYTVTITSGG